MFEDLLAKPYGIAVMANAAFLVLGVLFGIACRRFLMLLLGTVVSALVAIYVPNPMAGRVATVLCGLYFFYQFIDKLVDLEELTKL